MKHIQVNGITIVNSVLNAAEVSKATDVQCILALGFSL